jgi:hypothetical protein
MWVCLMAFALPALVADMHHARVDGSGLEPLADEPHHDQAAASQDERRVAVAGLSIAALPLSLRSSDAQVPSPAPTPQAPQQIALTHGHWFNGTGFEPRTMYSVDGRFASTGPVRIDRTIDLAGAWIVPPFGEAHNRNLGGPSDVAPGRPISASRGVLCAESGERPGISGRDSRSGCQFTAVGRRNVLEWRNYRSAWTPNDPLRGHPP